MATMLIEKPKFVKSYMTPKLWHCGTYRPNQPNVTYTGVGFTIDEAWQDLFRLLVKTFGYRKFVYSNKG